MASCCTPRWVGPCSANGSRRTRDDTPLRQKKTREREAGYQRRAAGGGDQHGRGVWLTVYPVVVGDLGEHGALVGAAVDTGGSGREDPAALPGPWIVAVRADKTGHAIDRKGVLGARLHSQRGVEPRHDPLPVRAALVVEAAGLRNELPVGVIDLARVSRAPLGVALDEADGTDGARAREVHHHAQHGLRHVAVGQPREEGHVLRAEERCVAVGSRVWPRVARPRHHA